MMDKNDNPAMVELGEDMLEKVTGGTGEEAELLRRFRKVDNPKRIPMPIPKPSEGEDKTPKLKLKERKR